MSTTGVIATTRRQASRISHCQVEGVFQGERWDEAQSQAFWRIEVDQAVSVRASLCPELKSVVEVYIPQGQYSVYEKRIVYPEGTNIPKIKAPVTARITEMTFQGSKRWQFIRLRDGLVEKQ
jgi:hypothetical protein